MTDNDQLIIFVILCCLFYVVLFREKKTKYRIITKVNNNSTFFVQKSFLWGWITKVGYNNLKDAEEYVERRSKPKITVIKEYE